jgi:hypothetical protein
MGKRTAVPLPAMLPLEQPQVATSAAAKKPEHAEMTVEGVHIPAKPIPPGEEGELVLYWLCRFHLMADGLFTCRMLHVRLRREFGLTDHSRKHPQPPHGRSRSQNCVYNIYADDVLHYNESLAHARSALEMSKVPRHRWPKQVAAIAHRHDHGQDGKGDADVAASSAREQVDDLLADMDPGLRAFLQWVTLSPLLFLCKWQADAGIMCLR